jgi:gluconolactonase
MQKIQEQISDQAEPPEGERALSRRTLIKAVGVGAGALALGSAAARAQEAMGPVAPLTTVTTPQRDFGPDGTLTTYFWDPDVIAVDPAFNGVMQPNSAIQRLWTGALWAEGPAWNAQGRYLVWSDIPNNRQMRWLEDDGHVSVFRAPSNNSNGNTFDFQGRQISCEHLMRRVVRYELDGSVTVLADSFEGKRLNSPNDAVPHPDGSIWFTDPPYGGQLYEGAPDVAGGPSNAAGLLNPTLGQPAGIGEWRRELPTQTYRLDPDGALTVVATEEQVPDPNGLCFSPDYKTLYIASTGKGPGDTGPGGKGNVFALDVNDDGTTSNHRLFTDCMVDDVKCGPDGIRCDVSGHVWISSNAGRNVGYSGVTVWTPDAKLIGRVRIPEICGNVCFGGPKRNRLFMAGSQSIYAVYTSTQGAAPG